MVHITVPYKVSDQQKIVCVVKLYFFQNPSNLPQKKHTAQFCRDCNLAYSSGNSIM